MTQDAQTLLVSVLVPVRNEEAHLREAAQSMLAQRLDGRAEFLFIDGESDDSTSAILRELAADPRIRILANPERATPNALNIGLAAARGQHVARMDAHTSYPVDYLAQGIKRLREGDVVHVSGPQIALGQGRWSGSIALALSSPMGTGGARFRAAAEHEFEVASGFTGVWERATLLEAGGWDVDWPVNQDAELAARLAAGGHRMVCLPSMAAAYVPRNSLKTLARQYFRYGMYRTKTSVRHPMSMRRSHLLPPALVLAALATMLPRRVGLPSRRVLLGYAAVTLGAAVMTCRPTELAQVPRVFVVLIVMHHSWGAGTLVGAARFGIPTTAMFRLLRELATRPKRQRDG